MLKSKILLLLFLLCASASGIAASMQNSVDLEVKNNSSRRINCLSSYQNNSDTSIVTLKPISTLKLGDKVLAKSEWKAEGESLSYEAVTDIMLTPNQERTLVHMNLSNGQKITTTDGHPFKTTEGWRDAILLKQGGKLLLKGDADQALEITDISHSTEKVTTYNLEVANAHTFFVGDEGVLVHNGFGAYTITFPDGTRYHGKGDYNRAKKSARRVGRVTGHFPCSDYEDWIDWKDALNDDDSFRKEHDRLAADGGPGKGDGNHNRIWGPGRRGR